MGVFELTFGFASLRQQQFDDGQETFGCGQVKRTVAHLAAHVLIRRKLQQQLCDLTKGETALARATRQQLNNTHGTGVYLLVAVTRGDMQRGEKHSILNVDVGSVLQEDICCLVTKMAA